MSFLSTAALFLSLASASVVRLEARQSACTDVHLFLARGNGEDYPGRVGALADSVCQGLPSCDYENILFDSTEAYCSQVFDGANSGHQQINAYSARCPNAKLVLGGYSLGAHIAGDILGGGGGNFYTCTEGSVTGISSSSGAGSKIDVALLFGDVRHTANQPYNIGDGSGSDGQYPRSGSQLSSLNQFSGVLRSWCIASDPICALGSDGYSHTTYMTLFANDAGVFAQQMLKSGSAPPPPPVSSSTSTTSVSSTSTQQGTSQGQSSTATGVSSSGSTSGSAGVSGGASSTSGSGSATITSSVAVSSSSAASSSSSSSSSFAPFVFSDSPTTSITAAVVAPTTTYTPTTTSFLPSITSASGTGSITSTSTSTSASLASHVTISSNGGAYSNSAKLTMNLVTLVVIKVLAF